MKLEYKLLEQITGFIFCLMMVYLKFSDLTRIQTHFVHEGYAFFFYPYFRFLLLFVSCFYIHVSMCHTLTQFYMFECVF